MLSLLLAGTLLVSDNPYCGKTIEVPEFGNCQTPDYVCLSKAITKYVVTVGTLYQSACNDYDMAVRQFEIDKLEAFTDYTDCLLTQTSDCLGDYNNALQRATQFFNDSTLTIALSVIFSENAAKEQFEQDLANCCNIMPPGGPPILTPLIAFCDFKLPAFDPPTCPEGDINQACWEEVLIDYNASAKIVIDRGCETAAEIIDKYNQDVSFHFEVFKNCLLTTTQNECIGNLEMDIFTLTIILIQDLSFVQNQVYNDLALVVDFYINEAKKCCP